MIALGGVDDSFSGRMSMIASTHDYIDDSFAGRRCRWLLWQVTALAIALTGNDIEVTLAGDVTNGYFS